ncbi:MAG: hypothetical protein M3174_03245 [Actinomycetota bacterium]|nr:hypothetical protein [Actinomycetota bacterium]
MKKVLAVALVVASLPALLQPASATHQPFRDAQDTRGKLDLRRVEMKRGLPRRWIIKTHEAYRANRIFDKGYLLVYFDTFGTDRADYYVLLQPTRSKIKGFLWKDRKPGNDDRRLAPTRVRRANKRSITTSAPFRKMRTPFFIYVWHLS